MFGPQTVPHATPMVRFLLPHVWPVFPQSWWTIWSMFGGFFMFFSSNFWVHISIEMYEM